MEDASSTAFQELVTVVPEGSVKPACQAWMVELVLLVMVTIPE